MTTVNKVTRQVSLPPCAFDRKPGTVCVELGFWNWNHSAWICDGRGFGDTFTQAESQARADYAAECRKPQVEEDAQGLGYFSS